jgi:DNA-binding XRE family transcriptional regulator
MNSSSPDHLDLLHLREICRLTQREAAAIIGVTPRSWIRYEKGERRMIPGLWRYFKAVCKARRKREQEALMNATTPEHEALATALLAYATRRSPKPIIECGRGSRHIAAQGWPQKS